MSLNGLKTPSSCFASEKTICFPRYSLNFRLRVSCKSDGKRSVRESAHALRPTQNEFVSGFARTLRRPHKTSGTCMDRNSLYDIRSLSFRATERILVGTGEAGLKCFTQVFSRSLHEISGSSEVELTFRSCKLMYRKRGRNERKRTR